MKELNVNDYLTDRKPLNDNVIGWNMKEYKNDGNPLKINSVSLWRLEKNEIIPYTNTCRMAKKPCYVIDYTLNNIGSVIVVDDMELAIKYTMDIINLIKA